MKMILLKFALFLTGIASAPTLWATAPSPRILYIGDSHSVGTYGDELDRLLRAGVGDSQVWSYGSCGSIPSGWISGKATSCGYKQRHPNQKTKSAPKSPTPKLPYLLQLHKPSHVVISLGGNLLASGETIAVAEVRKFIHQIQELGVTSCTWIGPPQGWKRPANSQIIVAAIQKEISPPCRFINSMDFDFLRIPAGKGDGIHYDSFSGGPALAKRWASEVSQVVLSDLSTPPRAFENDEVCAPNSHPEVPLGIRECLDATHPQHRE